eukprot:gnl/MRDRNA2_/MRDRNA2_109259_c0_seq1.p1 gnl/MRDRNA2_/MRDRNA2_109259_c0~~gnl/MRDRNA2_/MRDRNA2_109259_c0_seq1.p1  ORF type:complete len:308 (+),score=66.41 gnl/MRDRNA2_/MRDRNA2_109259_c0_seq1:81-1004(+)
MPGGYSRTTVKKADPEAGLSVNKYADKENREWKVKPSVGSWLFPLPTKRESESGAGAATGNHPLLMIEYQRLSKPSVGRQPRPDAQTIVMPGNMIVYEGPPGCYWEPTDPTAGDPYPLMEMIVAKPGVHYDNIVHVWRNPLGGELIGRPVDRSVLKLEDANGKLLYGPEVDQDTDRNGWNYGTAFERMDEPREGGRHSRRLTDWCRSRLWKFGNDQVMPRDLWALVPKVKMPGGGALQSVSSMPMQMAHKVQDQVVTMAGEGIICVSEQIKNLGEMVRSKGKERQNEEQRKKKEKEEQGQNEKEKKK